MAWRIPSGCKESDMTEWLSLSHRHRFLFQGIGLCDCGIWLGKPEVHWQDNRLEIYKQEQRMQLGSKTASF